MCRRRGRKKYALFRGVSPPEYVLFPYLEGILPNGNSTGGNGTGEGDGRWHDFSAFAPNVLQAAQCCCSCDRMGDDGRTKRSPLGFFDRRRPRGGPKPRPLGTCPCQSTLTVLCFTGPPSPLHGCQYFTWLIFFKGCSLSPEPQIYVSCETTILHFFPE